MINASINTPAKISAKSLVIGDVSKRSLGLDAVDNTSDLDKPISTAQQTAIDLKANQATTYTKVEVDNNIANLVDTAPAALDTLNELAAALGDDENFATTVNSLIALKAPLASPAFTGGATIDGADILHLNNIGIEVQPWSTILDDTTASFTTAIALAITDNSSNISTLNDDNTVDGSVAFAVKALADGAVATNSADIAANYLATAHNTDSVIICNDGDNIQDKYDEAALLTGNTKTLIVMAGTYGDLSITGDADVNVVGVGTVTIGDLTDDTLDVDIISSFKNFTCNSFSLGYVVRNIEDITTTSFFTVYEVREDVTIKDITCGTYFKSEIGGNFGTIKNVTAATVYVENNYGTVDNVNATGSWIHLGNDGTIKNCSGKPFLQDLYNLGIIDNCHSTGTNRGFGGYLGSNNSGTIKNCTATASLSFGQQDASGLTENCVCGGVRAFAGASNSINFSAGGGIEGTYKNCKGGNESFFGRNTKTDAAVEMEATYENCTGGDKSFGFVESAPVSGNVGPKTVFAGTAKNCTGGSSSFASSFVLGAQAEIKAGAVIENCTAKNKSFATHSDPSVNTCINFGNVIRSRCTGPSGFSATGTGKVRLCLDQTFTEINLG